VPHSSVKFAILDGDLISWYKIWILFGFQFGLFLKISCLNGHRSLLRFGVKVMSIDKFWKNGFYMSTLFKFVRVLQVKE